jgi:hypothetical protein
MDITREFTGFAAALRNCITLEEACDFERLALALFRLQFEHNAAYRKLCEARGASPATVRCWEGIPAVPTSAFKEFEVTCLPAEARTRVFHSSGTTADRPSRHFHNPESLGVYDASLLSWFRPHLLAAETEGAIEEALILTPPEHQAPASSLVHMFEAIRRELGLAETVFCGGVSGDGGWEIAVADAIAALRGASTASKPLLILGTAFGFVHLLDALEERHLRFQLPRGARVLETGGYKGRSRALSRQELHALITRILGVPEAFIVSEYGMSELSSQAYDKAAGGASGEGAPPRFRFPPWARVQVVSPETGREVRDGETGLIRVFDLANVYSVTAVETEDLGIRRADGFELIGRAAQVAARGCSLMSA